MMRSVNSKFKYENEIWFDFDIKKLERIYRIVHEELDYPDDFTFNHLIEIFGKDIWTVATIMSKKNGAIAKDEIGDHQFTTLDLRELERQAIIKALELSKWVQKDAAKLLHISPRRLNYRCRFHKIEHQQWRVYKGEKR